jgi:hypothetical protein
VKCSPNKSLPLLAGASTPAIESQILECCAGTLGASARATETVDKPFEVEIVEQLRSGRIVIIDLSQGNPEIQSLYSERISRHIFEDAMARFIANAPNNFVQFYFEEAHNLFPKKEDKDLSQIYNRLAKEGAKLNLGLIYATQEFLPLAQIS